MYIFSMEDIQYQELLQEWTDLLTSMKQLLDKLNRSILNNNQNQEERRALINVMYNHGCAEATFKNEAPRRVGSYVDERAKMERLQAQFQEHRDNCAQYIDIL